ncbi:MAG: hypothetical protein NVS3B20_20620 [Polyangiales bacterium]
MLFDIGPETLIEKAAREGRAPNALMLRPVRSQYEMPFLSLEDRVASDHAVRAMWAIVESLDLRQVESRIESNTVQGGRPAIDPRILVGLWVWGISQGEYEASVIARRTRTDDVYRWISGSVEVGERSLASFRASSLGFFESLFTQVVSALMSEGLIDLHRIAQDGTRVRAWCGADSFRRAQTLSLLLDEARTHYRQVQATATDPSTASRAQKAQERGARERVERIERALARARALGETKTEEQMNSVKKAPRASTTDPECTRMKMPDGGFRPAYNVQFATAADGSGAIVGVTATNRGNDFGELAPMIAQIEARTGQRPTEALVDGGYVKKEDIEIVEERGTSVFAPEPKKKADLAGRTASERSTALIGFYDRIESREGKAIYKGRGEVAELSNAHARSRFGLSVLVMRGLKGALTMALMVALTKDVLLLSQLRASRGPTESATSRP